MDKNVDVMIPHPAGEDKVELVHAKSAAEEKLMFEKMIINVVSV